MTCWWCFRITRKTHTAWRLSSEGRPRPYSAQERKRWRNWNEGGRGRAASGRGGRGRVGSEGIHMARWCWDVKPLISPWNKPWLRGVHHLFGSWISWSSELGAMTHVTMLVAGSVDVCLRSLGWCWCCTPVSRLRTPVQVVMTFFGS